MMQSLPRLLLPEMQSGNETRYEGGGCYCYEVLQVALVWLRGTHLLNFINWLVSKRSCSQTTHS